MEPPQKKVQGDVKAILIKGSKEERRALLEEATEETFRGPIPDAQFAFFYEMHPRLKTTMNILYLDHIAVYLF